MPFCSGGLIGLVIWWQLHINRIMPKIFLQSLWSLHYSDNDTTMINMPKSLQQRRAVRIIFGKEMEFDIFAIIHDIPLLADRRDRQMRQLFTGMHDSSHCLHRLLQESAIHTLRNRKNYRVPFAKTDRFKNSFILYALRNFQWVLLNSLSVTYIAYWHFIECIGLLVCYCHFIQP